MNDYQLTEVLPAHTDTLMISRELLGQDTGICYRIARVFALGVMRSAEKNMSSFIAPIDGNGSPVCEDTIGQETFMVHGGDTAPNGPHGHVAAIKSHLQFSGRNADW